ncbi:MAG: ubiquinone biosynthesis regulatory protein kinase UbiB [Gammaproteobacteria bacterium]|nr:ubiquinone biosynthesis regulatory protein kinase UbiB [Gammaproteobacteria bacterium]NVK89447.1 ubiquinone biosynthesis regulatory protein kinase UbiB [Gammaproteobacteria bacterium]
MTVKNLRRIFTINRVLLKYGFDEFLRDTPAAKYIPLLRLLSLTGNRHKDKTRGQRVREALIELGPIFVKFGQMLSTRRDLLPEDLANELMLLQDKVEPFSEQVAKQRIEQQLGSPIDQVFAQFNTTALASASIAQVHEAQLPNGEQVVVKVIRPGIRKRIRQDLTLLKQLAGWFEDYAPDAKRFKPRQVVRDYEATIYNELDLRAEAANTSQLKRNFENSELLYIPNVYWDLTREKVMVQERIFGTPIADVSALKAAGTNMQELAHRGVEIFFTQVFRDSFFHADMHPGNIFVDTSNPQKPRYIGIDCGIMGTLGAEDKRYLAANFVAFFERDYRRIAELHVQSGWIPADTPVEAFESAIRTACEPIFGKPLAEISFGHFLIQLFQVARRFQMEVQPQLVLLQKTLLYVEGLGRQLYPQLDLWATAKPFLKQWVSEQYGAKAIYRRIKAKWPLWVESFPDMPEKLANFLEHSQRETISEQQRQILEQQTKRQDRRGKRTVFALLGASLTVFAGSLMVTDRIEAAYIGLVCSGLSFLLALRR